MKSKMVTISVPYSIHEQLAQIADIAGLSLDDVFVRTLKNGMPPSLKKVPKAYHQKLLILNCQGDHDLWEIVSGRSEIEPPADTELINPEDYDTLYRAYAFSLLKWRGHPVPSPHEMML